MFNGMTVGTEQQEIGPMIMLAIAILVMQFKRSYYFIPAALLAATMFLKQRFLSLSIIRPYAIFSILSFALLASLDAAARLGAIELFVPIASFLYAILATVEAHKFPWFRRNGDVFNAGTSNGTEFLIYGPRVPFEPGSASLAGAYHVQFSGRRPSIETSNRAIANVRRWANAEFSIAMDAVADIICLSLSYASTFAGAKYFIWMLAIKEGHATDSALSFNGLHSWSISCL